ncbi:putative phage baseplate assembly protein [Nonomuraea polychroma]|uniref:Putative phage baseplate assembly protein n=1 Tax=Nonomuraea polychroma TaxID=46176 RepID=A0A438LZT2_9ACTN|nr:putative baseplate assembly protein [Nonomuraea polychroma]RVX38992.1 putative phage baseplate assembly protein [Nonomuraea polychroma]
MPLPAPNLDDRRFQDLVDEAKRLVQQRCPEWTDHNVSDPGVTLIETFAFMVDQLLYRLNRVTDLHYLRYLELIGVRLFPPTAARCDVTFTLSAAREQDVVVPQGTQVSTAPKEGQEPIVFTTESELVVRPSSLRRLLTAGPVAEPVDRTEDLLSGSTVDCFSAKPEPGDAMYLGLPDAVPGCTLLVRVECTVAGAGVDPRDPPLEWQAWTAEGWLACDVERDTTGGLSREGEVLLHVPAGHAGSILAGQRAGWIRCLTTPARPGQPFYTASPRLEAVRVCTVGGTVAACHADFVRDEVLGSAEGVPGQRLAVQRTPMVAGAGPLAVEVDGQEWTEVSSFAESGPEDRHVVVDRVAGEVLFGPAIRQQDGTLRHYGAVPRKDAVIRVPLYRTGGGRRGNVSRGVLTVQRDPVPFVSTVTNRRPASGGVDAESVDDAAVRGPLVLRTRDRAVTVEDYEQLAREAAPDAARVRCVPVSSPGEAVRVLLVPSVPEPREMRFEELKPPPELLARVTAFLDERRCVGARVVVEPPFYQGITVVAKLRTRGPREPLRARALAALNAYLNPLIGGPNGDGWPFGRPVQTGEVFAVLQQLPGVELVDEVHLFKADPVSGDRGTAVPRIDLARNGLVFSYNHQVKVTT